MCKKLLFLFFVFGVAISIAQVASAAPYIVAINRLATDGDAPEAPAIVENLQDGDEAFVDRTHVYVNIWSELLGAEYVRLCNDNKDFANFAIEVTLGKAARLHILVDYRVGDGSNTDPPTIPAGHWILTSGFTLVEDATVDIDESNNGSIDQYFAIYAQDLPAGTITLHEQNDGGGRNMYGIVATPPSIPTTDPRDPNPADGAINVSVSTNLSWTRGDYMAQEDVYFGTDPCALPKVVELLSFMTPEYDPGDPNIVASTTYYWQVVSTDSNGAPHPSALWSFTTVSGKSMFDYPVDGSVIPGSQYQSSVYTWLDFFAGATTVDYRGYCSEHYDDVFNRVEDANLGSPPYPTMPNRYYVGLPVVMPYVESLERGVRYFWTVDGIDTKGNVFSSDIWSFGVQGIKAFAPNPPNEATLISTDVLLTWLSGYGPPPGYLPGTPLEHDVYIGTDWDAVNDANCNDIPVPPEYKGLRSEPNFMATDLEGDTKIYWRIDEVWGRLPPPIGGGHYYKGDVWCFTTIPVFPITDPNLLVWWKFDLGAPGIAFDHSGHENHGVISGATWTSPGGAGSDNCLDFGGDGSMVEDADAENYLNGLTGITMAMWIKSNEVGSDSGFIILENPDGGDSMDIRYDSDGANADGTNLIKYGVAFTSGEEQDESSSGLQTTDWQHIAVTSASGVGLKLYVNGVLDIPEGDDAFETGTVTGCTTLIVGKGGKDQGDTDSWDGLIDDVQIYDYALSADEIRNIAAPLEAWAPNPYDGEVHVTSPVTLNWMPGKHADKHDVYFSTDKALVDNRNVGAYQGRRDSNSLGAFPLETGKLYYWAIDEVNLAGPDPCMWEGDTWIFRAEGGAGGLLGLYYHWNGILPPQGTLPYAPGPPDPFQIFVMSRIDPEVNWDWGDGGDTAQNGINSPDPLVNFNDFACRWLGHVECPVDANYTFYVSTDDGSRLFIDGQGLRLIELANPTHDSWQQQGMGVIDQWRASIVLSAGLHDIELHQYEHGGGAGARLSWSAIPTNPADDPIPQQIIPPIWLWQPLFASAPKPYNGEVIEDRKPALEWYPGVKAQTHDLFFSSVFSDVNERKLSARVTLPVSTDPCYPYPALKPPLDLNTEYYWLVDEYGTGGPWLAKNVWSFKTAECVALDNMEDYNDRDDMRTVWTDGYANTVWQAAWPWGNIQGGSSGSNLNASSAVGSPTGGIAPIHGGGQAMALYYDNDGDNIPPVPGEEHFVYQSPYYSEIEANTVENLDVPEDWASEGVKALTIWHTGHPEADGSFSYVAENPAAGIYRYTLNGRGRDIGGRHDEFYFLGFYPFTNPIGGSWIQARVIEMDNTNADAKAGLMVREKMTPYSRYAAVFVTPNNGVTFQWRATEDGPTTSVTEGGLSAPQEVKLERIGTGAFKAWYRRGGIWEDVNDTSTGEPQFVDIVDMNDTTHVGMAVTSHNADAICSADFNNVSVSPLPAWGFIGNIGLNNPEQLYVALKDGKGTVSVVNHPDPNAALATTWQEWNIELADFGPSLDFNSVKKVYIGLGDRNTPTEGGSGILYVDDVRACPPRCVPSEARPLADIAEPWDCTVNERDVAALVGDWLLADEFIASVAPSAANLIAHYELENNYEDSTIYDHDLIDPCGTNPVFDTGRIGSYAISLDGVDDHLVVNGNVGIDGNTPRTISCWAKADTMDITDWTLIFGFTGMADGSGGNGSHFNIGYSGAGISPTEPSFIAHIWGWEEQILPLDTDTWHHFAVTYDGTTIQYYGDGIPLDTDTGKSNVRNLVHADRVHIGKRATSDLCWPGDVDDARIYNYVLSDAEVAYLATEGGAGIHIPIVSPANLYNAEAPGSQWINFRDWSVLAGSWLDKEVWP